MELTQLGEVKSIYQCGPESSVASLSLVAKPLLTGESLEMSIRNRHVGGDAALREAVEYVGSAETIIKAGNKGGPDPHKLKYGPVKPDPGPEPEPEPEN